MPYIYIYILHSYSLVSNSQTPNTLSFWAVEVCAEQERSSPEWDAARASFWELLPSPRMSGALLFGSLFSQGAQGGCSQVFPLCWSSYGILTWWRGALPHLLSHLSGCVSVLHLPKQTAYTEKHSNVESCSTLLSLSFISTVIFFQPFSPLASSRLLPLANKHTQISSILKLYPCLMPTSNSVLAFCSAVSEKHSILTLSTSSLPIPIFSRPRKAGFHLLPTPHLPPRCKNCSGNGNQRSS